MKITKAMGRAALESYAIPPINCPRMVHEAFSEMGWAEGDNDSLFDYYSDISGHYHTALALCAAIAGVKPEDVE